MILWCGLTNHTNFSNNATQKPVQGYVGPPCPATQCGKCFSIKNIGPYGGNFPENMIGGNVTVEIIDACPATNAFNYCKSTIPIAERCGDPNTNSIDIDETAYQALTGIIWDSVSFKPFTFLRSIDLFIERIQSANRDHSSGL